MKILVADDERWIRRGILKMIDYERLPEGTEVLEADTVEGAFALFLEESPSLVISDVKFPKEDGCTLCERIYERDRETKIIMISGYNEFEYAKRALAYRAVDYLLKPVDKQALNDTIARCLEELPKERREDTEACQGKKQAPDMKGIVEEITKQIRKDYGKKYSLSQFADQYHVSEAYLSTSFKKLAGVSLMTYTMQVKIEKAQELMMTTGDKIWDIAAQVGYADQHYFTKVFKKITGESPSEYKAKIERELYGECLKK